ncbi:MAG: Diacetylchitobiose deacetylase [Candidatus Heimdallarchaeota archaeon LC_2]|nr:MAG: Diacetylchitobiose deacetylase [Candidatus Heimdallarchaeota archaeon LC_2]
MADSEKKTIISLFAHPDDELGAIGTLANHVERGDRVIMAWTTCGELTTLFPDLSIEDVKKERIRHGDEIRKIVGAEKILFLDLGDGYIENTREQRIAVARMYAKEKPDLVISWGLNNNHSDHRNTGYLAVEAVKFARINRIMQTDDPHRKNVILLQYYEKESHNPVKYIDVTDNIEKAKAAANFYAEIYDWKNIDDWVVNRRRYLGMESFTKYAEKFNMRFNMNKPSKFVI